jgi:hypothetical protein
MSQILTYKYLRVALERHGGDSVHPARRKLSSQKIAKKKKIIKLCLGANGCKVTNRIPCDAFPQGPSRCVGGGAKMVCERVCCSSSYLMKRPRALVVAFGILRYMSNVRGAPPPTPRIT